MILLCGVLSNERLAEGVYAMLLDAQLAVRPGQFIHVKCGELTLRRPISVASVSADGLRICYEVRGEGTAWLAGLKAGDKLDIMGAIGNGFDVSDLDRRVLLVGGGIGIYPLYMPAQVYGANAYAALGFRNKGAVNFEREFRDTGCDLRISTDDGSYGRGGLVTELAREILANNKIDIVMACGPRAMMRAVYEMAAGRGVRCQVSLEERMACGVGACLVCVCKVNGQNRRVCVDGPVFEGSEVGWEW